MADEANPFAQFVAPPSPPAAAENPFAQFVPNEKPAKPPSVAKLSNVVAVTGEGYPIFEDPEDTKAMMRSISESARLTPRSFLQGLADPINSIAQMMPKGIEALAPKGSALESWAQGEAKKVGDINSGIEKDYQAQRGEEAGPDLGRMAGNVALEAPLAAAVPGAAAAKLAPRIAAGAAGGALSGALQPTDGGEDFWSSKALQAGAGGVGGAVMAPVAGGIARAISPNVSPQVSTLMDNGIRPTPGQIAGGSIGRIEEGAQSIPFIGDAIKSARGRAVETFNRAAIDESLSPIGEKLDAKTPLGREAIAEAKDKIGGAYDKLLPQLKVQADPQFVTDMRTLAQNAQAMPPERADQLMKVLRTTLGNRFSSGGGMTGQSFKEAESELGRVASDYSHSAVADERQLGGALKQTQAIMRDLLLRSNPDHAAQLGNINSAYAQFLRVEGAAGRIGSEQGVFTPAQLLSATRQLDPTMRKGAFARGDALMQDLADAGKSVLGNKVPDSGTPFRSAIVGIPSLAALYGYSPTLAAGTAAGGAGLMGLYSKPAQAALAHLMATRPAGAAGLASIMRKSASPSLPAILAQSQGQQAAGP